MKDYRFEQALCITPDFGKNFKADGLSGLSPGRADTGSEKTIIEMAVEQGLLDKPVFTVWLEEKGSSFAHIFTEVKYIPFYRPGRWGSRWSFHVRRSR